MKYIREETTEKKKQTGGEHLLKYGTVVLCNYDFKAILRFPNKLIFSEAETLEWQYDSYLSNISTSRYFRIFLKAV